MNSVAYLKEKKVTFETETCEKYEEIEIIREKIWLTPQDPLYSL